MADWIKSLKVGDKVFIQYNYKSSLYTVEKITAAGNIKVNGIWFNSKGIQKGSDIWYKTFLKEATEEEIIKYQQNLVIQKAMSLMNKTKKISYEQARKIIQLLGSEEDE